MSSCRRRWRRRTSGCTSPRRAPAPAALFICSRWLALLFHLSWLVLLLLPARCGCACGPPCLALAAHPALRLPLPFPTELCWQVRVEQNLQRISELKEESARLGDAVKSVRSAQQAQQAGGNGAAELAAAAAVAPGAVAAAAVAAAAPALAAGVAEAGAHPPPVALTAAVSAARSALAPGHAQNRACGGAGPHAAQLSLEQEIEAQRRRGLYSRWGLGGGRRVGGWGAPSRAAPRPGPRRALGGGVARQNNAEAQLAGKLSALHAFLVPLTC